MGVPHAVRGVVVSLVLLWGLLACLLLASLLGGCAPKEEPLPPVPPPPEDLSTWSVPTLVQPPPPPAPEPVAPKDKATAAEQVLDFLPGTTFTLHVATQAPLDIVLARGEQVRNIVGGDRTPHAGPQVAPNGGPAPTTAPPAVSWDIKEGADGLGETLRHHLFLSAAAPGKTTGFIVTTTQRTYYLTCKSVGKSPVRVVRWRYPEEQKPALTVQDPGVLPDPEHPKQYHVGYELASAKTPPSWHPRQIVDDGKKTYILYPEVTLFATVPMVRLIGPNGPQLVNARQYLNVVILDQLVPRAELRVGLGETAEVVTITRGALKTITCPGDPACPVWPRAARILARKGGPEVLPPPPVQPPPPPHVAPPQTPASPPTAPPQHDAAQTPPEGVQP
jgi:type IV secretory pathway VirB9-like protein